MEPRSENPEEIVVEDVLAGLAGQAPTGEEIDRGEGAPPPPFTPSPAQSDDPAQAVQTRFVGDGATAVEWSFECVHSGPFAGIRATGNSVTVRGVTVIDDRDGRRVYRRYVDWSDVMAALGVSASFRPAIENYPPRVANA